jgi:Mitochondrial carrier protein
LHQVGIYFPLYDALAAELAKGPAGAQAPLVAGAVARTAAVLFTSPLELVRTRMQVRRACYPAGTQSKNQLSADCSKRLKELMVCRFG